MPHDFEPGAVRSHQVQVLPGLTQVQLPNGFAYDAGDIISLTDHEYDQIASSAFGVLLTDLGQPSEGVLSGSSLVFVLQIGTADPVGSPGPRVDVSPVSNFVFTNTKTVPLLLRADFLLKTSPFPQGSCQPDLQHEISIDSGPYNPVNQHIPGMSGAFASDPALGGDGTGNPAGINTFRSTMSDSVPVLSGGGVAPLPFLAPGATITIDHKMTISYVGVWNATLLVFNAGIITMMGFPT